MEKGGGVQRGFSLVTAIFLLVVVAGLGAMMATFFAAQQQDSAMDVLGLRAYRVARAGAEWGVFQIAQSGVDAGAFATACQAGSTNTVPSMPASWPWSAYGLGVSCSASSYTEGTASAVVYELVATASGIGGAVPGDADYVERQVRVGVWGLGASQIAIWK